MDGQNLEEEIDVLEYSYNILDSVVTMLKDLSRNYHTPVIAIRGLYDSNYDTYLVLYQKLKCIFMI